MGKKERALNIPARRRAPAAETEASPHEGAADVVKKRSRLDPQAREKLILDGATVFFAKHGFESQTKDLAAHLGVSQGLIFRYFGTKQNLVERVYQNVFLQRWSSSWVSALRDRSRPLQERLETFYLAYFRAVDDNEWIRVSLYASLSGSDIIARYVRDHVDNILQTIAQEVRFYTGHNNESPIDPVEYEIVWHLHSTFIYALIRKYIHHVPIHGDAQAMVGAVVGNFLNGIEKSAH